MPQAPPPADGLPLKACHCCGLVQILPALEVGERAACSRCRTTLLHPGRRAGSRQQVVALALSALCLYPPAIGLPILHIEQLGRRSAASIWEGSIGLLREGQLFVGAVVLLCSVILPLAKLGGLLLLCSTRLPAGPERALTWRAIEWTGRFGMLDVLLIAVVVAWVKLGDLARVEAGPAAIAFTLLVLASLLASARFDPHAHWERDLAPGLER
jgi:uncharacterized paraquat-inducible protein A